MTRWWLSSYCLSCVRSLIQQDHSAPAHPDCETIMPSVTGDTWNKALANDATNEWCKRLRACIHAKEGHFKHLIRLKSTHAYFLFPILWTLQLNRCYCFKYVRFLLFLIFYISQGSVATRLRRDGKYDKSCCKFIVESNCEKIFEIGQHLPKLCLRIKWRVFWLTV